MLPFPRLQNGVMTVFTSLSFGDFLNDVIHVKCLEECLTISSCLNSICCSYLGRQITFYFLHDLKHIKNNCKSVLFGI